MSNYTKKILTDRCFIKKCTFNDLYKCNDTLSLAVVIEFIAFKIG